ncbi:MAG: peptidoglycan DD-metalloendopeptidase family protein [Granulosicoccus sp.]
MNTLVVRISSPKKQPGATQAPKSAHLAYEHQVERVEPMRPDGARKRGGASVARQQPPSRPAINPVSSRRHATRTGAVRRSADHHKSTSRLRNASFVVLGLAVSLGWLLGLPAAWNTHSPTDESIPANQIAQAGITPPIFFFDDQANALDQLVEADTNSIESDILTNTIRRSSESNAGAAPSAEADNGIAERPPYKPAYSASEQHPSSDSAGTLAMASIPDTAPAAGAFASERAMPIKAERANEHIHSDTKQLSKASADTTTPASAQLKTAKTGNITPEMPLVKATGQNNLSRANEELPNSESTIATEENSTIAKQSTIVVKRGDTLSGILNRQGISIDEMPAILAHDLVKSFLSRLEIGQQFELTRYNNGEFQSLSARVQGEQRITISKTEQGLEIDSVDLPVTRVQTIASGRIDQSLYLSAAKASLQQSTIMDLADIFQWELDFARDIQQGDQFSLIYDKLYREGEYIGDGNIIAAQFIRSGRKHTAIRFRNANNEIGYYSPNGKSKKRTFMRHPVDVVRITSRFNPNRLHPVLHQIRAHRGVDYGSPYGSPIYATADGVVKFSGNRNAYGKTVILQHGKKLSTLYAHMSKISGKTKAGSKVRQGDVIGYVGKSGRVTGVHLHYEFRVNGVQMDPLVVELPAANPVERKKLTEFKIFAAALQSKLEKAHVKPDESVVKAPAAANISGNLVADNKPLSTSSEFK